MAEKILLLNPIFFRGDYLTSFSLLALFAPAVFAAAPTPGDAGIVKPTTFTTILSGNLTSTQTINNGQTIRVLSGTTSTVGNASSFLLNGGGKLLLDGDDWGSITLYNGITGSANAPVRTNGGNNLAWVSYTDITTTAVNPRGGWAANGGVVVYDHVRLNQFPASGNSTNPIGFVVDGNGGSSSKGYVLDSIIVMGSGVGALGSVGNDSRALFNYNSTTSLLSIINSRASVLGTGSAVLYTLGTGSGAGPTTYADDNKFYVQGGITSMGISGFAHGITYANGNLIVTDVKLGASKQSQYVDPVNWDVYGLPVDASGDLILNPTLPTDYLASGSTGSYGAYAATGASITFNASATNNASRIIGLGNNSIGMYSSGAGSRINSISTTLPTAIDMLGNNAIGAKVDSSATLNLQNTIINTTGNNANGIVLDGSTSNLLTNSTNGSNTITTAGTASHGIVAQNAATKTFDGGLNNVLPNITVSGDGSALLDANTTSTLTLSGSTTLSVTNTLGANSWGAKAEQGGKIVFTGASSTGGTRLWAAMGAPTTGASNGQSGAITLSGSADAAGSHIKLDDSSILDITGVTLANVSIGSLESASATTNVSLGGKTLYIGSNNLGGNGSLIDATYAGKFSNTGGKLVKEGGLTQTLSGVGNTVSSVDVQSGTLRFAQTSGGSTPTTFRTTGAYTTEGFATTDLGANNSVLDIGGTFTQMANSHLKVELGAWLAPGAAKRADIIADKAVLGGDLEITGFTVGARPNRSSEITDNSYNYLLISTTNGITGTYTGGNLIGAGSSGLDYLSINSHLSGDLKDLWLGFSLNWYGDFAAGTGDFTIDNGSFTVDTQLDNQTGPFASWDGESLTKYGDGILRLDADNTYTGKTTVNGGMLQALRNNVFADSSDIIVNADGTLDLNGTSQTANRLSNDTAGGGLVTLNGGVLTTDNNSGASVFSGVIANGAVEGGGLIHQGGILTLTGDNTYTGTTVNNSGATLQIGNGGLTGSLASSNIANAGTLTFNRSDDSAYGGLFSGAGALVKDGAGTLTLNANGSGASQQGSVEVKKGVLVLAQDNGDPLTPTPFTVTGDYTTRSDATTRLGSNNSVLDVDGAFTQEANSKLEVELGAWTTAHTPDIVVGSANLQGTLEITGFTAGATPNSSHALTTNGYLLLKSDTTIVGGYDDNHLIGAGSTGLDYLSIGANVGGAGNTELWLGFALNWTDGGLTAGTGNFTIDAGRFTVDDVLEDQLAGTYPVATWDGKSLVKKGDGVLRLAEHNTYTGTTTIDGGVLQAFNDSGISWDDVFAASSDIIVNANGILDINGTNQIAQRLKNDTPVGGIVTLNGGVLTVDNSTGDSTFTGTIADGDVTGGSLIKTGADVLTLSGKTLWTGDTTIEGGALILDGIAGGAQLVSNVIGQTGASLSLVNGATLTGWIDPLVMDISDTSTWNLTGNSVLTSLTQAGTVNFVAPPGGASGVGRTLTVDSLIGQGGTIRLYTVLGADASATDRIVIDGGLASGSTLLDIRNAGGLGAQTMGDGIMVVDAINGATTAAGAFSLSGRVAAGAYDYDLFRTDIQGLGQSWYLRSRQTGDKPNYRDEVPVDMTVSVLGNRLALDMLGTYDDRRNGYETDGDFQSGRAGWGRAFGKSSSVSYDDFVKNGPSYDANSGGVQTGMDLYRQTHESGAQDNAGFYLGIGRSEATVDKVNGGGKAGTVDLNGYGLGAYWTHHGTDGWYADAVVQGMHYGQTAARSEAGEQLSTNGWGLAASAEGGYPILLAPGWTLTPQLQLVYQRVSFDDGQDQFGRIAIDDSNVVYGRAGAKLGKALDLEDGQHLNVWTRMNVWNAFNDTGTTIFTDVNGNNPTSLSTSLGGQWGEIGVGASGKITKDATLFAGMDYGRALGDGKGDSISARIGVSVLW